VHTYEYGDRAVVHVGGDLDVAGAAALREELVRLVDAGVTDVLVELTEVPFLDSTAMGALVAALKRIRGSGGRMELAITEARVMRVLRIAGLTQAFTIHSSVVDALLRTDHPDPTRASP